jgi:uncharacterized protein YdbL (DUF1318 family)
MKKTLILSMVLLLIGSYAQAQVKIVGEKGTEAIVGEKGIIGEKRPGDAAIVKNNAQIETAFAEYYRQREEMEKSLAALHLQIEEGIKLLEKYKRFRSAKQGIRLRNTWKEALKLQAKADGEIKVVKASVVAPDMVQ